METKDLNMAGMEWGTQLLHIYFKGNASSVSWSLWWAGEAFRPARVCPQVSHGRRPSFLVPVPADSLWVTLEHLAIISPKNCTESTDLPSTDVAAGVWLIPERRRVQCPEKEEVHGTMMDKCLPEVSDPLGLDAFIHHKLTTAADVVVTVQD